MKNGDEYRAKVNKDSINANQATPDCRYPVSAQAGNLSLPQ